MKSEPVIGRLKFLANTDGPLVYIPSKGGGDETEHVGNYAYLDVPIRDARMEKPDATLDAEGFALIRHETAVKGYYDDAQIAGTHHDEVIALLKEHTGAEHVEIFDDTRRSASVSRQQEKSIREPAEIVHNDYTAKSGVKRLLDHFADRPEEATKRLKGRFAIVNLWRSIAGPVMNNPLTVCDATSVSPDHLVSVERRAEERIGELQLAVYDKSQRWYYYPQMQVDESMLIKTFDSATDGPSRFTIHTSFVDPSAPEDSPPRESIETRCLVFF